MNNKYGLKLDIIQPEDWRFGSMGTEAINPSGDWTAFLPVKEFQNLNGIEPYACVLFTLLNCVETLIKYIYGEERNYSDRFLATLVNTRNGGCSPKDACEVLRKMGVVPQDVWPFDASIDTADKFFAPVPDEVMAIAEEFIKEWEFNYEFVPSDNASITAALKCSPLLFSVAAWFVKADENIYYRPEGMTDNHATTCFSERVGEYRRMFDSYDMPRIKDYDYVVSPLQVMRFRIKKREVIPTKKSWWRVIIDLIVSFFR